MLQSELFCVLPNYVCTPDGMAIDRDGNLVISCPNYAEDFYPGMVVRIDKQGNVKKWFEVPVHPETGIARNMGIAFDDEWNIYLCDNQGWSGKPELQYKGRILKVTVDDAGNILRSVVVAKNMEHPNGIRIKGKVRGAFLGLSVTTGKAEMARAVMEGVGMNLYVILQALKTQVPINRLALIGGGAQGDVWPQILADIWGMPVETAVHSIEATSMGAAICAGVGIGLYRSFREAFVARMETRIFNPDRQANAVYRKLCPLFEQAYESLGKVSDGLALLGYRASGQQQAWQLWKN